MAAFQLAVLLVTLFALAGVLAWFVMGRSRDRS
jgi:uncharacterized membrane protein YciS (DUF1049 family)